MSTIKNDLTGQTFGRLTARELVRSDPKKGNIWRCDCECGGTKEVPATYLRSGHTKSCGCMNEEKKSKLDITGQRWGRLVAVKFVGYTTVEQTGKRRAVWLWKCDCGNEKEIPATYVKHGNVRSCGCKFIEHITSLRTEDITDQRFGKLVAVRPTEKRDKFGGIIWEMQCDCGNLTYKTINVLKTGKVLSCGCYYKETRPTVSKSRKDFIENTSISNIVVSKRARVNNSSGYTGVWFNSRQGTFEAYINFKKKRYYLGGYKNVEDAARARRAAEAVLHDPVVLENWDNLTDERKEEFKAYLRSAGEEGSIPPENE